MKTIQEFTKPYMDRIENEMAKTDWTMPNTYANWLAQTHYYICHSTRILAAAGSRFQVDQDKFHIQAVEHAKEEKSHEKLTLADLKHMKFSINDFPELPSTKALYRSAYYLIERENPISLYGYVYYLELLSITVGRDIMERASNAFGAKSVQHLKLHAQDDVEHIETYAKALNQLGAKERSYVEEALVTTANNYESMICEIRESKNRNAA